MIVRAVSLLVMLAGIGGCDLGPSYGYREPCDEDANPDPCCPPGSHLFISANPEVIICATNDAGTVAP